MGDCGSNHNTLVAVHRPWAARRPRELGCSAALSQPRHPRCRWEEGANADPPAPAGARCEGGLAATPMELSAKLQPGALIWFAAATRVLLDQTENSCLQEQGFCIPEATVNLAMTLFSYLQRTVCALLLRHHRNKALWLTPHSRAIVFYKASCKEQE